MFLLYNIFGDNMKALIDLPTEINQTLNIIKAKRNLKNKVEAISLVVKFYAENELEPELRPDFIKELLAVQKENTIKVKDFAARYH